MTTNGHEIVCFPVCAKLQIKMQGHRMPTPEGPRRLDGYGDLVSQNDPRQCRELFIAQPLKIVLVLIHPWQAGL